MGRYHHTQTHYATYTTNALLKPTGLFISSAHPEYLFIADSGHNQIDYFVGSSLTVLAGSGQQGAADGSLTAATFDTPSSISGIGFVQRSGGFGNIPTTSIDLIVTDSANHSIRHICFFQFGGSVPPTCNFQGVQTVSGGTQGYQNGSGVNAQFSYPGSIGATATLGSQVVADLGNNAVRSINSTGTTVQTAISPSTPGLVNGPLATAQFRGVTSLTAVTGTNPHTLLTDTGNFVVRAIDANNNVTTFAGSGVQGYADGPAATAMFAMPVSITYNPNDTFTYVADTQNNCIRRIDPSGNVTTYAGIAGSPGLVNGPNLQAEFSSPTSIVIANGFMYVADTANNAVRRIDMVNNQVSTYIQ